MDCWAGQGDCGDLMVILYFPPSFCCDPTVLGDPDTCSCADRRGQVSPASARARTGLPGPGGVGMHRPVLSHLCLAAALPPPPPRPPLPPGGWAARRFGPGARVHGSHLLTQRGPPRRSIINRPRGRHQETRARGESGAGPDGGGRRREPRRTTRPAAGPRHGRR